MPTTLTSGLLPFVRLAVLIVLGLVLVRPAMAQTRYVVEDLGALPGDTSSVAWAINEGGDVVSCEDTAAVTNSRGVAVQEAQGPRGFYTLTILGIALSRYTFDASHSVRSKSLTVP